MDNYEQEEKIEDNNNSAAIIVVEQLPIITAKLKQVKLAVLRKIADVASLVVTEKSKQTAKKVRADLNREFELLEDRRKAVKKLVIEPYDEFEGIYKREIASLYKNADAELKNKIDAIENTQIEEKIAISEAYFQEYAESLNINFLTFGDGNFKINLGTSQKALKEKPKTFIDNVDKDLKTIEIMEYKEEIVVEYKKHLDLNKAIFDVNERHKAIAEIKAENIANTEIKAQEEKAVQTILNCIAPPKTVEEQLEITFKATGTKSQLIALREFMKERGIRYE